MEDETKVIPDTSEQEELVEVDDTDTREDGSNDNWEAKAKKAQEIADNYKRRAEKAERKAKEAPTASQSFELTQIDVIALAKSDIHDDDIERVTKFAKMEGISVKEALSNDDMRAILDRRTDTRKAAEASNTGSSKSGISEVSGQTLKERATSGNMPDVKDLHKMWEADLRK